MSESSGSLINHLTVLDTRNTSSDYSLITLEKPTNFTYTAGQCISVGFPDMVEDEARIFSIASSPTEDVVNLLVKHGISAYKQRLLSVEPGDELLVSEPTGGFRFSYQMPAIMVAGGMGIAPFRSIAKQLIDSKCEQKILLIHLHPTDQSPFAEDFTVWQNQHEFLRFISLTDDNKRLDLEGILRQQQSELGLANAVYYLAGPSEMVMSCRQTLEEIGVDPVKIQADNQSAAAPVGR